MHHIIAAFRLYFYISFLFQIAIRKMVERFPIHGDGDGIYLAALALLIYEKGGEKQEGEEEIIFPHDHTSLTRQGASVSISSVLARPSVT